MQKVTKNNIFGLICIIFLLAICWQLFWSSGIDFFWEDFDVFHLYWDDVTLINHLHNQYAPPIIKPSKFSVFIGIAIGYFKNFFAPQRLFQIGFNPYKMSERPYNVLTCDLMSILFRNNALFYRIFKAVFFAINTCIIFLITNRVSRLFALLGIMLYMTSAEIWLSSTYIGVLGLLAQCGVMLSVLFFIKLLEKEHVNLKGILYLYSFIFIVSNFASLIAVDGRYLAIIFFFTILFFKIKSLKFHLAFLLILFVFEFPILGFVKKWFFDNSFNPINFGSHSSFANTPISSLVLSIVKNYIFPRNALGKYLLITLLIVIVTHVFYEFFLFILEIFRRLKKVQSFKSPLNYIRNHTFLFLLWFIVTFFMCARSRSFNYGPGDSSLQLFDLIYFIAPFITFLAYYITLIAVSFKKVFRIIFIVLCVCLIITQTVSNVFRLNRFRGGWGNHFCSWQNAKKYIDRHSNKALALAYGTDMHYRPFVFGKSNNKLLYSQSLCDQTDFCDLEFIESKFKEGYKDIFVFGKSKVQFKGNSKSVILYQQEFLDGDSGDLYDRFKRFIGHPSKPVLYLYHFKFKDE